MDAKRFDTLTKAWGSVPRRQLVRLLAGSALAGVGTGSGRRGGGGAEWQALLPTAAADISSVQEAMRADGW
jgi:hypothetical protein